MSAWTERSCLHIAWRLLLDSWIAENKILIAFNALDTSLSLLSEKGTEIQIDYTVLETRAGAINIDLSGGSTHQYQFCVNDPWESEKFKASTRSEWPEDIKPVHENLLWASVVRAGVVQNTGRADIVWCFHNNWRHTGLSFMLRDQSSCLAQ